MAPKKGKRKRMTLTSMWQTLIPFLKDEDWYLFVGLGSSKLP